ncbi:carboxypeptidase-like regulatory domain-containing protein [Hymenobacter busanensis]|nr:carboxypeptidase-like regulatory domain-containing protein [Hymenobacter busanensis]QHJ08456.1 hypothetical protein GUY19_14645 [Hymenobacter busanensis]
MTPTATGRHCAACQKVVIDFTQKTDAELLAFLRQRPGNTCGRFAAGQLQRPLQPARSAGMPWRTWLAAAATLWGLRELSAEVGLAQGQPVEKVIERTPSGEKAAGLAEPIGPEASPFNAAPIVVRGVVVDSATHEPVPGATILLTNTTIGVASAVDGSFSLELPADISVVSRTPLITISSVGYVKQHLKPGALQGQTIALAADSRTMGEVVITKISPWYSPSSLWWRARSLFIH